MYKNTKKGWYKMVNPNKFIIPADNHMKSFNESAGAIEYKSSLELKAFKYADFNKHIVKFSVEPFPIQYIKPSDGKYHRYYPDMFLQFSQGNKFLVEIKPKSQTKPPVPPKKKSEKALKNYYEAMMTYQVNQAKWEAAKRYCKKNGMSFVILTETQLS